MAQAETTMFIAVIILILIIAILASSIKIVREYERAVMFRLGRLIGAKGPGLFLRIPIIDIFRVVDLRVSTFDVPKQSVITKDNVTVDVDAVVYYRVYDSQKAVVSVENYNMATDLLAQATLIIGERNDSHESIQELRKWINYVNPDVAIFMILTPFPGTALYDTAKANNWIEDDNWAHYDMIHAVMPTNYLSRKEVQEELYKCYRSFYGSMKRRITGLFSPNTIKRRTYTHLMRQGVIKALSELF